jgi:hypothetical protein
MKSKPRSERDLRMWARRNRLAAAVAIALVMVAALVSGSTEASADSAVVTAVAPTFSDDVCSNFLTTGASYAIPSTVGVDYFVNGALAPAGTYNAADGATVTVTAQAQPGFSLTGTTTFTHTFSTTPSCTTHVTAAAPSFADDLCTAGGSTGASYTVPTTAGVDYLVNGVKTAAGTYHATDGTKVSIVARAQVGFSLAGSSSFVHMFAATCLTGATPAPPVFADDVCSGSAPAGASFLIPATAGVDYLVNSVKTAAGSYPATDGTTVTVSTQAQTGFALSGTTSFAHTFGGAPTCTTSVTPAAPAFVEDVCSGSTRAGASYTIPAATGFDYFADGVKTAAGTYPAADGSTTTVTTSPHPGFALTGTTSFTHTFAAAPTCTTSVTPAAPSFVDDVCVGSTRAGATYTIPAKTGVDYFANGVKTAAATYPAADGSTITITTSPQAGFALTGTTSFTHTFAAAPTCTVVVTPAAPTFSDATCSGGAPSQALYTIPSSAGVDYFVNGVKTAAGSYNGTDGSTITITTLVKAGYKLTGASSFTHVFAATPTCTTSDCQSRSGKGRDRGDSRPRLVCRGWFSEQFRTRSEHFRLLFRHDSHRSRRR